MRFLLGLFRLVLFVIPLVILFVFAVFALLVGMVIYLVTGRRPRFQIHTAGWNPQRPQPSTMKDVTPQSKILDSDLPPDSLRS